MYDKIHYKQKKKMKEKKKEMCWESNSPNSSVVLHEWKWNKSILKLKNKQERENLPPASSH